MKNLKRDQNIDNPCLKEQQLTDGCFHENNFDYEKCTYHIENYKACKTFWVSILFLVSRQLFIQFLAYCKNG